MIHCDAPAGCPQGLAGAPLAASGRSWIRRYQASDGGPLWIWTAIIPSRAISASAGGLILWPAKVLVPVGFVLLGLQGISELIKRIAFLRGLGPDPTEKPGERSAEEELAEEIKRQHGEA